MASNLSRLSTSTIQNPPSQTGIERPATPSAALIRSSPPLPAGPFQRVPENPAQGMPDLVMQQRINRKSGPLDHPRLGVGRHPRLAGQHGLEPQRGGVPGHRLTEAEALGVSRL